MLRLFSVLGLAAAADPTIFHDEAPTEGDAHHSADGEPKARGMDNYLHARPTRAPSPDAEHDWDNSNFKGTAPDMDKHGSFVPTKYPTPSPTFTPTTIPTRSPTSIPTIDSTRVIKTCASLGSKSVVWYNSANTICTGKISETTCPGAKRCVLSKTDENGKVSTSTCSHVHCKVQSTKTGRKFAQVHHHHAEVFGTMHICEMNLHKDNFSGEHCGCECFVELAGDNDWLSGLAKRAVKRNTMTQTATRNLLVHKRIPSRNYYGDHDGITKDGTGYKNHEDVTMFDYKNKKA